MVRKKRHTKDNWSHIPKPTGNEGVVGYAFVVADLPHWGHINFLKRCKRHCDFLIVGVYVDELVMEYKRKPVYPFWQRIAIVKELRDVDMVVKVNRGERDQTYPMKRLTEAGWKLKCLFHATDWNAEKDKDLISAKNYIESIGGQLVQPPYTKGISTTNIIRKIVERYCGFTTNDKQPA